MGFRSYLLRRAILTIPVFIGLTLFIFLLARVLPGDPARMALGPRATDEAVAALRIEMGLDDPLHIQYLNYMGGLLQGDMGIALTTNRNVFTDVLAFFPATLELVITAMFLAVLFGIPLGIIAALNKDRLGDNLSRLIAFFGVSMPVFWAAILIQLAIAYNLGLLPPSGRIGVDRPEWYTGFLIIDSIIALNFEALRSTLAHLALPAFALALAPMADVARMTRSSFIEEYNEDYVRALETQGLPGRLIAYKYVLKASFASTLTIIGLDFGFLIGGAFLVEIVFSWPGLARYGVRAILENDINAVMGVVLVIGAVFIIVNLIVDVLYGFLDPRVRYGEGSSA